MLDEIAVVGAKQNRKPIPAELFRFRERQQLDEEPRKLHDVVVRAPRVTVSCSDRETKAPVQIRRRIEIAHGMNDMVEASRHRGRLHQPALLDRSADER
jgi:hypothetical protein